MTGRSAWVAGNGAGLTPTAAFNTTDLTTSDGGGLLANTHTVLSTVVIDNGASLDQFMDLLVMLTIGSSTTTATSALSFWLYELNADGTTYGDGRLTAGTAAALVPAWPPIATIPLYAAASQTLLRGTYSGIILPPRKFSLAMQNNSGFTLTNTSTVINYITYNINLNA